MKQELLSLTKLIYLSLAIALLTPFKGICQKEVVELKILSKEDSTEITEEIEKVLPNNSELSIQLKLSKEIKHSGYFYLFEYNENEGNTSLIFPDPTHGNRNNLFLGNDTIINLVSFRSNEENFDKIDSFSIAVLFTRNLISDFNYINSKFSSFAKMLNSEKKSIPSWQEIEQLIVMKQDNLLSVEPDLQFIYFLGPDPEFQVLKIFINPTENKKEVSLKYNRLNPSKLQLEWSNPKPYITIDSALESSTFNHMISDAAEKHLHLSIARGIPDNPVEHYKFTLKEVLETLKGWKKNKVGLLLYSLNKDTLNILYVDNQNRIDTSSINLNPVQLLEFEKRLKEIIQSGPAKIDSSEKKRGIRIPRNTKSNSIDSITKAISNILLPSKFNIQSLEHLIIVPTLNISAFPFSMLKINDSTDLIDLMSYSIVPSINEFIITGKIRNLHYDESAGESSFNIKSDSVYWSFNQPVLFVGYPDVNSNRYGFRTLPGTKIEIIELSKKVTNPTILIGKNALKSKVLAALPDAKIIYFATHAYADSEDPLTKSFILLSGNENEIFLTPKEIQKSKLEAALVVLSACETGLGKAHEGGMIGLARAFEIAGAKNVLMSLWQISDNKTPLLMSLFFDSMGNQGRGQIFFPHDALRKAIIDFKKKNPNPVYWAAFSMFGVPL